MSKPSHKSCLLLVNQASRSGEEALGTASALLREAGFDVERPDIPDPEASRAAIAASDTELIVVGGGDGTISSVAGALIEARKTVGLLPLGTANDLARSLGIPASLNEAVDVIARGVARPVDIGIVNGRYFFNAVTVGLGPEVREFHENSEKQLLGVLNYPRAILRTMRDRTYFKAEIIADGKTRHARFLHIGIVNGRYHGGGLPAHRDATIYDGVLHLYAVRAATPLRYLRLLPSLLTGRHGNEDLLRMDGETIRVTTKKPMPATGDGEVVAETPLELTCRPAALTMMVPVDTEKLSAAGRMPFGR
ncbi:MAG: YegS/Rv2252/BmrU family lipid kinase [Geminicoccaceae bacterium]